MSRKLLVLVATAVALVTVVPPASAAPAPRVTVMTRNLFLGADLIPLATTAPGAPFQQAAGALYDGVVATELPGTKRHIYAATYGEPPDPPATAALLQALAEAAADVGS